MDTVITFDNSLNECFICLDNINDEAQDIYILECCKNVVHLKCLHEWCCRNYNKNCFICNQYNKLCDDLSKPLSPRILSNNNDNANIIIIQQNEITTTNNFINARRRLFITYILFFMVIIIFIIIFSQDIF